MSANLDDACRAWEAAKRLQDLLRGTNTSEADAKLLLTNAEAEYRAALIDAAERRFDALGIKVGETECIADGWDHPFFANKLRANVEEGTVSAYVLDDVLVDVSAIRPYTAPEAKQMVLESHSGDTFVDPKRLNLPYYRLTLSNVTPADLDAMNAPITGAYTLEKL